MGNQLKQQYMFGMKDCHNCGRSGLYDDACSLSVDKINICLQNKNRPFWQKIKKKSFKKFTLSEKRGK